jgi:dTDP-L-rhamnose 4-epimerase
MKTASQNRLCVVTGGAGFIGTAIAPGLADRFDRLIIIDILHSQIHGAATHPASLPQGAGFIRADITEPATWDDLLSDAHPAVIIHLAAETGTGQSLTESARHSHTNVCGTAVMLDALARHNKIPDRILLASSRAIYGEGAWRAPDGAATYPGQRSRAQLNAGQWDFPGLSAIPSQAANTPPQPVSVYGATKLAQEHLLTAWASAFGADAAILRLQNVYGPGQSLINSYTGILALFCRIARAGNSIPLYEDGQMLRDFVLIDDVAAAILAAIDNSSPTAGIFDVGTGAAVSIAAVAAKIAALYNAPPPHICAKFRFGDVRHAACAIGATTAALGWQPRHTVDAGLARLTEWIETQL